MAYLEIRRPPLSDDDYGDWCVHEWIYDPNHPDGGFYSGEEHFIFIAFGGKLGYGSAPISISYHSIYEAALKAKNAGWKAFSIQTCGYGSPAPKEKRLLATSIAKKVAQDLHFPFIEDNQNT